MLNKKKKEERKNKKEKNTVVKKEKNRNEFIHFGQIDTLKLFVQLKKKKQKQKTVIF